MKINDLMNLNKSNLSTVLEQLAIDGTKDGTKLSASSSKKMKIVGSTRASQRRLRTEHRPTSIHTHRHLQVLKQVNSPEVEEVAALLIKYHGNLTEATIAAAQNGDLEGIKTLLTYGGDSLKNSARGGWGGRSYSLLDLACLGQNVELVEYLIDKQGMEVSPNTFLAALLNRHNIGLKIFDGLLSKGNAFPQYILTEYLVDRRGNMNEQDVEIIKFLLSKGVKSLYLTQPGHDHFPTIIAESLFMQLYSANEGERSNARQITELLLPCHLITNLRPDLFFTSLQRDASGKAIFYSTPLLAAIAWKDVDLVSKLIAAGANVNGMGRQGKSLPYGGWDYQQISPLQLAINLEQKEILVLLMTHGSKP